MDGEGHKKEVYFDKYCRRCVHKNLPETDKSCHFCLKNAWNLDSHKPVNFLAKNRHSAKRKP